MARLDTDLLGLQVVSKENASIVGELDGLIIDGQNLRVAGFLVNLGLYEAKVLPFSRAEAIGEDAVIVAGESSVTLLSEDQELQALAEKEITLSGVVALTLAGKNVGAIGDFFVDPQTGELVGFEFLPLEEAVYPRETAVLPISVVHRLGRDIVVLTNDYDQRFVSDGEALTRKEGRRNPAEAPESAAASSQTDTRGAGEPVRESPAEAAAIEPEPPVAEEVAGEEAQPESAQEPTREPVSQPASEPLGEGPHPEEPVVEEPGFGASGSRTVEEGNTAQIPVVGTEEDTLASQQRHFLIGKRVLRRVESPSGEVIAREGDVVDYELIQRAKRQDLLLVLSLNVD